MAIAPLDESDEGLLLSTVKRALQQLRCLDVEYGSSPKG